MHAGNSPGEQPSRRLSKQKQAATTTGKNHRKKKEAEETKGLPDGQAREAQMATQIKQEDRFGEGVDGYISAGRRSSRRFSVGRVGGETGDDPSSFPNKPTLKS